MTLPLVQLPLGRAFAQCLVLARRLMLLNDGRHRGWGSSGLQPPAIWREGRANPAGIPNLLREPQSEAGITVVVFRVRETR